MQKLRVEEISRIISDKIANFDHKSSLEETGTVLTVGDGIARAYGLDNAMAGELVEFETGVQGVVLNLESDNVGIAFLGSTKGIEEGSTVKRTKTINSVPVGKALIGRVVNAVGEPIDGCLLYTSDAADE